MKNILGITLTIIFLINPAFAQDTNPIKWGISIGSGQTTFEQDTLVTSTDGTQSLRSDEADFTATMLSIDARSGNHQVSFSTNTADEENLSLSGSFYTGMASPSRSSDYDDMSITYTYSLGGEWDKWRVSLGYNSLSMDKTFIDTSAYSDEFVLGEIDDWTVTETINTARDSSGATALVSYVQPLGESGKWIGVARLGFTAQDYEGSGPASIVAGGLSESTLSCYAGTTCNVSNPTTLMNGDGYDYAATSDGDSTSVVFGFSLVYVFANPRHTLNFDFSARENEYGELNQTLTETPRGGFFTRGGETQTIPQSNDKFDIDETMTSFSIKYRYGLN